MAAHCCAIEGARDRTSSARSGHKKALVSPVCQESFAIHAVTAPRLLTAKSGRRCSRQGRLDRCSQPRVETFSNWVEAVLAEFMEPEAKRGFRPRPIVETEKISATILGNRNDRTRELMLAPAS